MKLIAWIKLKRLLSYLPQNNKEEPLRLDIENDDINRLNQNIINILPENPYHPYDIKEIIKSVVDDGKFFEVHELFAENIVVGFARIDGHSVGIVANQPLFLAGALDIHSSVKAAKICSFL